MRTSLLAFGCAVVLAACGSSGTTDGNGSTGGSSSSSGGGSSSGASGSSGGSGGSSSGAGDDGGTAGDTGAPPGSYTITFGPIQVPPSTEKTQCIIERLGNAAPLHVGQIHDLLGTSSHHMIVYKVNDTTEQKTPFDCQPFQGALNPANGNPLIISQKKDDLLTLPPNVAFTLDANQMIRFEMHYINATTQTVTLQSSTTMIPIPDADYKWDASFLFIGDMDISIPPMSSFTLGPQFFPMPSQFNTSNFFAITGHEHQWGTKVQVWDSKQSGDLSSLRYTNTTWSDPVTTQYAPPLRIGSGGGFTYQCDWYNASSSTVGFGESANDEMCFFWAYYWPSQGAQVCFQSKNLAPVGGTACCPMAGAAICNNL